LEQVANRQFQQRPRRPPRIALGQYLLFHHGHVSAFFYSPPPKFPSRRAWSLAGPGAELAPLAPLTPLAPLVSCWR
jgi:hypothetical protein